MDVEHLQPVRANDTISLSGRVVDKRTADRLRLVECAVAVETDRGEPVGPRPRRRQPVSRATPFPRTTGLDSHADARNLHLHQVAVLEGGGNSGGAGENQGRRVAALSAG